MLYKGGLRKMKFATLTELLKALVETEDQMERMAIVEENQDLMATPKDGDGEGEGEGEGEPNEWETKYNELKKKYIDTFFGGEKTEETTEETTNDETDEETKRAETISIEELTNGGKK